MPFPVAYLQVAIYFACKTCVLLLGQRRESLAAIKKGEGERAALYGNPRSSANQIWSEIRKKRRPRRRRRRKLRSCPGRKKVRRRFRGIGRWMLLGSPSPTPRHSSSLLLHYLSTHSNSRTGASLAVDEGGGAERWSTTKNGRSDYTKKDWVVERLRLSEAEAAPTLRIPCVRWAKKA